MPFLFAIFVAQSTCHIMRNRPKGIMMFFDREFAVHMRKRNKNADTNETPCEEPSWSDKVATTMYVTKTVLTHAAVGVCAYVLLDTYRQVQVAKHTPPPVYR